MLAATINFFCYLKIPVPLTSFIIVSSVPFSAPFLSLFWTPPIKGALFFLQFLWIFLKSSLPLTQLWMPDGAVTWLVKTIPSKDTSNGNEDHFTTANLDMFGIHPSPSWEECWCLCSQADIWRFWWRGGLVPSWGMKNLPDLGSYPSNTHLATR